MIRPNYAKDAPLLEEEILDYDTLGLNETGINDGRMRLPTRYDISKFYQRNKRNWGKRRAGEYGHWKKKSEDEVLGFSDDFEWQITYSFPAALRNPVTPNGVAYGGRNVTFRRLYLILCERFNGGEYFIDSYFDTVYPYTVKSRVDEKLSEVKSELLGLADYMLGEAEALNELEGLKGMKVTKGGRLSKASFVRNRRAKKALADYESFAREWEGMEGEEVARMIKEDIISCVTSGQLPCQFLSAPAESTMKKRLRAGLGPLPLFSATEQLIRSLQLYVHIRGSGEWKTQSGLLV